MTHDPFDLHGRWALITGGSRGIGLAMAQGLGQRGAATIITARKEESLRPAQEKLEKAGITVRTCACHQGQPAAIAQLFEELDCANILPEIVVINAGTNPVMGPLVDLDRAAWNKILDVNLTGALVTAQHAARRLMPRKKGSIIMMASIAGLDPLPGLGGYSVSKAGLLGLVKALARELGPHGIRVNAIAPGLVDTRFSSALFENQEIYARLMASVPLGRHGLPQDVAGAAVFLAADASAYIIRQVLVVDGGGRV